MYKMCYPGMNKYEKLDKDVSQFFFYSTRRKIKTTASEQVDTGSAALNLENELVFQH